MYVFVCVRFVRAHTNKKNSNSGIVLVYVLVRFSHSSKIVLESYECVSLCVYSYDSRTVLELCENRASVCMYVELGGLHEST